MENRKGVFGRVANLLHKLDEVSTKISDSELPINDISLSNTKKITTSLLDWESSKDLLFSKFEDPETAACVATGLLSEVEKLPLNFPWQNELSKSNFRVQIIDANSRFSGNVAAEGANYSATLKSVKSKLLAQSIVQTKINHN